MKPTKPNKPTPSKKKPRSTIQNFQSNEDYLMALSVCDKIHKLDKTFHYTSNDIKRTITLTDTDVDRLHKRSLWLVSKFNENVETPNDHPTADKDKIHYQAKVPLSYASLRK